MIPYFWRNAARAAWVIGIILFFAACTATASMPTPGFSSLPAQGNVSAGQTLFQAGTRDATACGSCHVVDDSPAESGPSLKGIAGRAATRVTGQSAEDYLYTSIIAPNAYLVAGYSANLMPQSYGKWLSPQQQRNLIAYLMTLN